MNEQIKIGEFEFTSNIASGDKVKSIKVYDREHREYYSLIELIDQQITKALEEQREQRDKSLLEEIEKIRLDITLSENEIFDSIINLIKSK